MDLVVEIYKLTHLLPPEEKYNPSSQIKQAVISIPANIADGNTKKEFANFLHIAQGSLSELDTHLEAAKLLGFLKNDDLKNADELMTRIDKMLTGLIKRQKS